MMLAGAAVVLIGAIATWVVASHDSKPAPPAVSHASAPAPVVTENSDPIPAAPKVAAPAPAASQTAPPPAASQPQPPAASQPQPATPQPQSVESPQSAVTPPQGSAVKGEVASRATPDVPQHILATIQGHVRVRILVKVDAQGHLADATLDDPGPSRYFAAKALAAARNWTFTPAQSDGHPVASTWMLHFSFGHDGATVMPEETAP
jgi:TonB family protein